MVMAMNTVTRTTPESGFRRRLLLLLLAAVLGTGMQPALAARDIPWEALSKSEQSVLRKHRGNWSSLRPAEQARLRRGAQQYLDLPSDKRKGWNASAASMKRCPPKSASGCAGNTASRKRTASQYRVPRTAVLWYASHPFFGVFWPGQYHASHAQYRGARGA